MKESYFYAILREEFALPVRVCREIFSKRANLNALYAECRSKHRGLCLRLLNDFIVPADRVDLFRISHGILRFLERLICSDLKENDEKVLRKLAEILSADPFAAGEAALRRADDVALLKREFSSLSSDGKACFDAGERLCVLLTEFAVRNG